MAFQPVPDTAEITIVMQQNLEAITNTFHAEKPGGYTLAEISALANLVDSSFATHFLPIMTLDNTYLRTEVRGLTTENDLFDVDGTNSAQGQVLVEGLPNNCTLSIKKQSGFTGRSARGRWYFCGFPVNELETNENQWQLTAVDSAVIALEALRGDVLAGPWTPVIVSRFTGGLPRAIGVTFDWLSSVAVNLNVDSQRGRLTR